MKGVTLLLLTFVAIYGQAIADNGFLSTGQSFPSPDGRFTARIESGNYSNLRIRDNRTGVDAHATLMLPLLSLKWTGNSKAIVTVEHIAGGSIASITAFSKGWTRTVLPPPRNGDTCEVVKEKIGWDKVFLTYKVKQRTSGLTPLCWTSSFDVNASTEAITSITTQNISLEDYLALTNK